MNTANMPAAAGGDIVESVITKGDLAKLSTQERTRYYVEVCKSVGLNPLTKPFEYITLNGKLTLYALRNATDQLRTIYGVSVEELTETTREGVYIVTAKVRNKEGRSDMAKGAVTISNLKGDALANAIMKCETKAKRRATLSICGLGFLDESELETIPARAKEHPQSNGNGQSTPPPQLQETPRALEATLELASAPESAAARRFPADPPHDPVTGEITESAFISQEDLAKLIGFADNVGADKIKLCKFLKIDSLAALPSTRLDEARQALAYYRDKKQAEAEEPRRNQQRQP